MRFRPDANCVCWWIPIKSDKIDDVKAKDLAKSIAKRIEDELKYPGRIKVTIIREMRVVEYAR